MEKMTKLERRLASLIDEIERLTDYLKANKAELTELTVMEEIGLMQAEEMLEEALDMAWEPTVDKELGGN